VIEQTQDAAPYSLQLPVAVQLEGQAQAYQTDLTIKASRSKVTLELPARPLQVEVDPEFDVFRRLHRNEIPPAVSQIMGAERLLIVLPAAAPAPLQAAYRSLAEAWRAGHEDTIEISYDNVLWRLPKDSSVWLFGWDNRFRAHMASALSDYDVSDTGNQVRIAQSVLQADEHALVVLGRHPRNPAHAMGWLAAADAAALPGLGRKLPHYGRYSYLGFSGEEPANFLKGQWPVIASPMSVPIAAPDEAEKETITTELAPRTPLASPPETFSTTRMQRDIAVLADAHLAGRGLGTRELDQAADYIAGQFQAAGLQAGGDADGDYFQTWKTAPHGGAEPLTLKNVVGILPGTDPERAGQSLVIGAHYDHLGRGEQGAHAGDEGRIHPGADDNASGVAVMLELARVLAGKPQPRSIVFVAFTGEESARLGSRHYVQHSNFPLDKTIAMLNLDTVGRLGERPLTVFGSGTAREWVHIFRGAGYVTGVPIQDVADDIGSSDQTSFIEAGVPAVQLFSGVHDDYHRPGDTADKIDPTGLVKTAKVLKEAVDYLAERPEALSTTLDGQQQIAATGVGDQQARRASLGTVPDYAYSGDGVRITGVQADTPAAQAGLREEDIIVSVNEEPIRNLRDYAQALRALNPGDEIRIRFRRDGGEQTVTTRVTER
jgi:hypothetical protein